LPSIAVVPWTSKIGRLRFLAAVLGIPLFDALLGYVAAPVVWWLGNHGAYRSVRPDEVPLRFGLVTGTLGFLVMFTAGIPVAVLLIRRRWTTSHHFAVAGILLGNLPFAGYLCMALYFSLMHLFMGTLAEHLSPIPELLAGGARAVFIGSVMGAASGVAFWLVDGPEPGRESTQR
jgi:hypothetical protein